MHYHIYEKYYQPKANSQNAQGVNCISLQETHYTGIQNYQITEKSSCNNQTAFKIRHPNYVLVIKFVAYLN